MIVKYTSNNSGGSWWLTDDDWKKLEEAGWYVYWGGWNEDYTDRKCNSAEEAEEHRWLGCLAKEATKEFNGLLSIHQAKKEFEEITNCNVDLEGCPCCGQPHYFDKELAKVATE